MICPKCGFEQPDDIFCASCGVNVKQFSSKSFKIPVKSSTVIFILMALFIAGLTIFFYPKVVSLLNMDKLFPEGQITDTASSSTFGASSNLENPSNAQPAPADTKAPPPKVEATVGALKPEPNFEAKPVATVLTIGEMSNVEINQLLLQKDTPVEPENVIWGLSSDIPFIRRAYVDREMRLKSGENKINYSDEFARFDITIEIKAQDQNSFKASFLYSRRYEPILQVPDSTSQLKFETTIPYQKMVYIIDKLPRIHEGIERILAANSLISQLHKSSTFLNDTSESVMVFQFAQPQ